MRALIVEDDYTSRIILENILKDYGLCDAAANGLEAVAVFRRALDEARPYDLICMDIVMPELSGQDALRQIRHIEKKMDVPAADEVKVVMTTASSETKDVSDASNPDLEDYTVQFEARDMADILAEDDGLEDEAAFVPVAAISQANDACYRTWMQPWVRALTPPMTAEMLRQLHPLRLQRSLCSDANPFVWPLAAWSSLVKQHRHPVSPENPFVAAETCFSSYMTAALNLYRDTRDRMQEWIFKSIYANPWIAFWWGAQAPPEEQEHAEEQIERMRRREAAFARRNAGRGGFPEAVIRIIIAVTGVDRVIDKRQVETADAIVRRHKLFEQHSSAEVKQMVRDQARILSAQNDMAISGLAAMLPTQAEREKAFDAAVEIAVADFRVDIGERRVLMRIRKTLQLHHNDLHR